MKAKPVGALKSARKAEFPQYNVRSVIVPLDGTVEATKVLPVAARIAVKESCDLYMVHAGQPVTDPKQKLKDLGVDPQTFGRSILEQSSADPAESILQSACSKPGPVLVMCTHTSPRRVKGELGSVARAVICRASCPVLLVPPDQNYSDWEIRRVLFPHDGTPASAIGIGQAFYVAYRASAELLVLHVCTTAEYGSSRAPGTLAAPRYVDQWQHEMPSWTREFLERLEALAQPPTAVNLQLFMAAGNPGSEILRLAREQRVDLIVLTWQGSWDEPVRAETIKKVIDAALCPVLLLRVTPPSS